MCLFRRDIYILAVEPFVPQFRSILEGIVERLKVKNRVQQIIALCPELQSLWDYPTRTLLYDVFGKTEEWHNHFFEFESARPQIPGYAMAYKQITCNHMKPNHFSALLLGSALKALSPTEVKATGLSSEFVGLMQQYWEGRYDAYITATKYPNFFINTIIALSIAVASLKWLVQRTSIREVKPTKYFFAADFIVDPRDYPLYDEMSKGGPVLLVPRNPTRAAGLTSQLRKYDVCMPDDGRVALKYSIQKFFKIPNDILKILVQYPSVSPSLFYNIAALPYRQMMLDAFFDRFQPKYFWGRDDYNVEHILRRTALNRIGGQSLGIAHGFPVSTKTYPMWRYISFDTYYVASRVVYDLHLKDTWIPEMEVKSVGTFGARSDQLGHQDGNDSKDIAVFTAMAVGEPNMISFIRGLAGSFPERTIILQIKGMFADTKAGIKFAQDCTIGLDNIEICDDPIFDIFGKIGYAISDPSTLILEAMQCGVKTFLADVIPYHSDCIFREFEDLCIETAQEAVQLISKIESREKDYLWEQYRELSSPDLPLHLEVICRDVGLKMHSEPSNC